MSDERFEPSSAETCMDNGHPRSLAGQTSNDRFGRTQIKVDCSGCDETVTRADQIACGCTEAQR